MSKADEMFKKLGYEKRSNYLYRTNKDIEIYFSEADKTVVKEYLNDMAINESREISMQELQAINEKVKELGWNEL